MITKRRFLMALASLAGAVTELAHAQSEDYPRRPIKLIIGFAPGGSSDATVRTFALELERQLGQPIVVENRAGATGLVAMESFAHARPDGYTLMMLSNVSLSALHVARKPLDMDKRFTPIGMFSATRVILVVNPKMIDVRDLAGFTDYVRRHPDLHYTSAGHGGLGHLGMELWSRASGLKLSHVPYRGTAPALEDVRGGRVPIMVLDANAALPLVEAGVLRAVVNVSSQRSPAMPDLPTALELGVPSLQIDGTIGLVAPPATPAPILDRLRSAIRQGTESEAFAHAARGTGAVKRYMDAPEYGAWLLKESERWGGVIREIGLDRGG
ncbi:tripartite tricarboxylate transporter substrate binding protein [uncultured Hydrogenophaga sp.]|uniref:Bug family tripartite tricarboxylate transporter substrate binding protein n=1 Tax=uncultured Hydrogenophaga sp. TaxID=199683 RepID=UPI002582FC02|nr:tripartite tricarboxylate transporter substrate binding protein [uncultured Hydrogenophaga sp.]